MQQSALGRTIRLMHTRYRDGIARLGTDAWTRWKWMIGASLLLEIGLVVLLVAIGRGLAQGGSLDWEQNFLRALPERGPFTFSTAVFWQTFGTDITLVMLIALTAGIAIWNYRPITAWSIALGYIAVDPLVRLGWALWDRSRPDVLYHGVASPAFHSFPSGHTAKTVAVYGVLIATWFRATNNVFERTAAVLLWCCIATVVPLGRLSMGVHWPSDIIGGFIIGLAWLAMLLFAMRLERPRELR